MKKLFIILFGIIGLTSLGIAVPEAKPVLTKDQVFESITRDTKSLRQKLINAENNNSQTLIKLDEAYQQVKDTKAEKEVLQLKIQALVKDFIKEQQFRIDEQNAHAKTLEKYHKLKLMVAILVGGIFLFVYFYFKRSPSLIGMAFTTISPIMSVWLMILEPIAAFGLGFAIIWFGL